MVTAYTFLLALFLSMALIPLLMRVAPRLGMVDLPGVRKVHHAAIPRIGGVAIIIGVLVPALLWVPMRTDIQAFLMAVAVLALFGVADDKANLDYRIKFVGQIIAALILVFVGDVSIHHFPYVHEDELPTWIAAPVTVLVLVGVTNAVNLSDGLDGLAGGTSILAIGFLGLLAWQAGDEVVVQISLAIVGATLGFLRFNTHPARVFMGDTGSQFLGFSAGTLAIIVTQKSNTALSPILPLLVLGLPILDTLWVMITRIRDGYSPFAPDRRHIHHRLLDLGLSQYEVVTIVYAVQLGLILIAYQVRYAMDGGIALLYILFSISVVVLMNGMKKYQYHFHRIPQKERPLIKFIEYLRHTGLMVRVPMNILKVLIPLFLVVGSLVSGRVDRDVGMLALLMSITLLVALKLKRIPFYILEKVTLFTSAASVAYLLESSPGLVSCCERYLYLLFGVIVILLAVWVRFSGSHFRLNTMDFLVVIIMVFLPRITVNDDVSWGTIAIESVILFYAIEMLMLEGKRRWDLLRIGMFMTLSIISIRGLLF